MRHYGPCAFVLGLLVSRCCTAESPRIPPRDLKQSPLLPPIQHAGPPNTSQRYDDEQVWRLDWESWEGSGREALRNTLEKLGVDIWRATPHTLDVRLHPSQVDQLQLLVLDTTSFRPIIPDLQSLINISSPAPSPTSSIDVSLWNLSDLDTTFHESYHSLDDLYSFGDALAAAFSQPPGAGIHMDSFIPGRTYEGRPIRGWRAWLQEEEEVGPEDEKSWQKREFVVQSGQHAREWVGPATAMYFLHSLLLSATQGDASARLFLKTFTVTVVPTINPDGYVYSHEHNRMWRKNRQDIGSDNCVGIDLNSNWGYKWVPPRLNQPCSETYAGQDSFEAYETRAMANYLMRANGPEPPPGNGPTPPPSGRKIRAFVDLHSYGQLFMFPFAHSCDDFPPDAEMLMEAALGVAKAMRVDHGEGYQAGQACELTYRAPGDAIDFSYGTTDVRWSYSAELRDTGTYGFMLPPEMIRPSGEEVTAGLLYLAKFIYTAEIAG